MRRAFAPPLLLLGLALGDAAMAACGPIHQGQCGAAFTVAQAPDGSCWQFPDDCLPDGWHESPDCAANTTRPCD